MASYKLAENINKSPKNGLSSSLVAQTVKNLPARQETSVRSTSQEHPLEKGMAAPCSILA